MVAEKKYFIVNLQRTKKESGLVFWRKNFSAFTTYAEEAGEFDEELIKGFPARYNDGVKNVAIPVEDAYKLFPKKTVLVSDFNLLDIYSSLAKEK